MTSRTLTLRNSSISMTIVLEVMYFNWSTHMFEQHPENKHSHMWNRLEEDIVLSTSVLAFESKLDKKWLKQHILIRIPLKKVNCIGGADKPKKA